LIVNSHRWVADDETHIAIQQVGALVSARVPQGSVLTGVRDQIVDTSAKRLRPLLLLLCARAAGRPLDSSALRAAAAVEILHEATLVHDDMVDASQMRRARPSVQARHGLRGAAFGGSALMYSAMSLTSDLPEYVRSETALTAAHMARSQVEEVTRAHDHTVTPLRRMRIMYGKTASLFRLAAVCGTRLGGCEPDLARAIVRTATLYGMAYQLADDIRDVYAAMHEGADLTRCDLIDGVATLPILLSLSDRVGVVARVSAMREQIAAGERVSHEEVREVARLIADGDGMAHSARILGDWHGQTRQHLADVGGAIPAAVFGSLVGLLDTVGASTLRPLAVDRTEAVSCPT